ncbi:putative selenium-dependent hydroxylase accessory protein YqeC [Buttiauxella sp. A2-C2_NF]|uniref:selenium cofactor biosynthesis protein YqeC n=1 Tax=Buttiauxella ferragutiae TaxID=82989 RepID=UPI001E563DDE|nr:selenium cofactor biosynthesis protein YqeC [Buttiauxella ferragutiae]MCE0826228.1 putative selenium-dependent hydroxylase accessory protein YqeC [Buttiauxella ferragutiae]
MTHANIPAPLNSFGENKNLFNQKTAVISIVGAGGKTSTLFWLAREFARIGKRVIATTTTQMYLPEENIPVLFCRSPEKLPGAVFTPPAIACFAGWNQELGKVRGFSPAEIDALAKRHLADVLLLEADGAHGFPLKAPALHEPCIAQSSDFVIAVMGGQAINQPIEPQNVHRWPLFSAITGLRQGGKLGIEALKQFINHPHGMFKQAPPQAKRIWLINQCSHIENITGVLPELLASSGLDAIWLGAVREFPPITHVLLRDEGAVTDKNLLRQS